MSIFSFRTSRGLPIMAAAPFISPFRSRPISDLCKVGNQKLVPPKVGKPGPRHGLHYTGLCETTRFSKSVSTRSDVRVIGIGCARCGAGNATGEFPVYI